MKTIDVNDQMALVKIGVSIMEPSIDDVFISKRVLMSDGIDEEDVDELISMKVREYSDLFGNMTNEELSAYVSDLSDELEGEIDYEDMDIEMIIDELLNETVEDHIRRMYEIIDLKIKEVFLIKRAMVLEEKVSQENLTEAILEKARDANEYYTNMNDDEICSAMDRRVEDLTEPWELTEGTIKH